ncbi:hypothetical protein CRG98_036503 [Punica granatum]|uniref:Integrase catalytic domain-containing protein n=1 Tax=Punica granatum TaxID=22663 RepID=A0A2I0IGJ7_PUNGR|nr:hypothetical protein CRG98_036503 [Punica granatum]
MESTGSMFKLNAINYSIWKSRMEDILFCRNLYDPSEGNSAKPKDKDDKAWEHANRKTIGLIRQWINNSIYHHVAQETNAKVLWNKLANFYARKTPQNKAFIVKKLVHLRYQDGDTSASFHVTPHWDFFSSYTSEDYGYVRMGNGQSCKIVGIGDVYLETELGCKLLLKKVRNVPKICLNLISTGQLNDEGYNNKFSNGRWKLSKDSLIMARGQKTDTLYRLRVRHNSGQVDVAEDYLIKIWHRRLGHINEKTVERETGMKLKCVRSDNGGEYRGPFENYCRIHGIKLERTVPKTPQQNGLVEMMNRTIVERMYPSRYGPARKYRTGISEFLGCRASIHIPRDERSKLDAKAKQCIFLDYAHEGFGYKFWDPNSRKIIRSRDVVFFEDQTIKDLHKFEKVIVGSPHKISIPVPVNVEYRVEELPTEYVETMTGSEIPQVNDDVTEDDTDS